MPQIVANYKFNSRQPNFARDQVQTYEELLEYGGWNTGDSRYQHEDQRTDIDLGHIVYVVERNQHYTYVKITEVDENNEPTGSYHYGWAPLSGSGAGYTGGEGGDTGGDEGDPDVPTPLNVFAYFKSMVFKRGYANQAPALPGTGIAPGEPDYGGTFFDPVPYGWSDGIPAVDGDNDEDNDYIWMTTRVFSSGGAKDTNQQSSWTTPQLISDSKDWDYEFSELKELDSEHAYPNKQTPSDTATNGWSNTATENTVWMAIRQCENGLYKPNSEWQVIKIKGEDGEQALKIKILGRLDSLSDLEAVDSPQYLDAYLVGDNVYVWDGDSWSNSGPFRGTYDGTKSWAYLHIKYSDDGRNFTSFGGEVPGKWVGTYCDYEIQDSSNFNDYYWKQIGGGDGFGYEYIYTLTMDDQAPDVPDDHTNSERPDVSWDDFDFVPVNWTDDPGRIDATWRWCWVCYRVAINGHWSEFKGAHGKTAAEGGKAALYAHYGSDAVANSASRNFMIFTWTALDENADPKTPFVPEKPADNVAKWNVIENILELNEGQDFSWSIEESDSGTWDVNPGNAPDGLHRYLWMSTASFSEANDGEILGTWSDPVCLTGSDGRNGTDGVDSAFAYHLCNSMEEFAALVAPTLTNAHNEDSFVEGSGWTDHPQGISPAHPIEAASVGTYNKETLTWSYSAPFIWARWGEDGIDGDGVEYVFFVASEDSVEITDILDESENKLGEEVELKVTNWLPTTPEQLSEFFDGDAEKIAAFYTDHFNEWNPEGTGWTDDPSDVGPFQPYEFVSMRKFQYDETTKEGKWGLFSEPALWAKYAKDGTNGRSVFTSFVFTRTDINLHGAKLFGGTVEDPKPEVTKSADETQTIDITWEDTVPSGSNAPVWMSSRIFDDSLTGEGTGWKSPTLLQDTPEFQVEYTNEEVWNQSALPSLNDYIDWVNFPEEGIDETRWRQAAREATGATWGDIYDDGSDIIDPWWMITSRRGTGGVWTSWAIHKIKGEKGEPGTSISVKGNLNSYRDLGDSTGDPAGLVDHSSLSLGDCYVIGGLLWIYDGNNTKTSPYSTDYVTDPSGNGQILGDKYAGFSCQGQFKGDPGTTSWIHVRFANKSEDQSTPVSSENENYRYFYNNEVFIEFTGATHSGTVPGKYAGIAITSDVNIAPSSISQYEWTEWRGDDIYGTEQIFILSDTRPEAPSRPNEIPETTWNTFDYVPSDWSDTPLDPTPDAHCWVSTRRLSDPEDKNWKTPAIYTRYAHDGNNGVDGAVNEFIYHLGEKNSIPSIDLSKAKKGADTINSDPDASWWESDESRDFRPFDGEGYWADNPQGVEDLEGKHIEYYSYRTREYDDNNNKYVWTSWSPVKIWSSWGQKGRDGDGVEYIFTLTKIGKTPSNPTPYTISEEEVEVIDTTATDRNGHTWFDYDYVPTIPVASDYDPEDPEFTEHTWYDDPQEIGEVWRYQWVSMRRSHSDSEGNAQWTEFSQPVEWNKYTEDGKDGRTEEFIYFLSKYDDSEHPIIPTIDSTKAHKETSEGSDDRAGLSLDDWQELVDYVPALGNPTDFGYPITPTVYWNDNPYSISQEWPLEYRASRFKKDGVWSEWRDLILLSTWGQKGHDGDGVEYIFTRTANKSVVPDLTGESAFATYNEKSWTDNDFVPEGWTDDPKGTTPELRVEWVSIRKTFNGVWAASGDRKCWSEPKIWNEYDDSRLKEEIYHHGGKTEDPVLNKFWDYRGVAFDPHLDGFLPSDVTSDPGVAPSAVYTGEGDYDPEGWTPFEKGIDPDHRYEYKATRTKNPDTGLWSDFKISRCSAWGEDGDSVEFVFWMISQDQYEWIEQQIDVVPNDEAPDGQGRTRFDNEYLPVLELFTGDSDVTNDVNLPASDNQPADPSTATPYVYYSKREKRNGEWQAFSPIRLYTKLFVAPEYSCTLNLGEDKEGIMVVEEGNVYKSVSKYVSTGLTDTDLRYGANSLIIGKVEVQPVNKTVSGDTITASLGQRVTVWEASDGPTNNTTISVDGNSLKISVTKNDTFYYVWFSWSSSNGLTFKKDSNGDPIDLSFIIYASGGTAEGSTEKVGYATYNIHPVAGDTLYELSPTRSLFKKRSGSTPFDTSSISSFVWKKSIAEDKTTSVWANSTDWNEDPLEIRYRVDDRDPIIISGTLQADGTISGSDTSSETNPFSWTLQENTDDKGAKLLYLTIKLYESVSGGGIRNYAPGIEDGITIQVYRNNVLHDEEFIPVVYNGKKGNTGDYLQEETAYWLQPGDTAPSAPASSTVLVAPTNIEANNVEKWLNAPYSPTVTNRYLFVSKRMNQYYGQDDEDLGIHFGDLHIPGTWGDPFLFASRSVGEQGDTGRGIESITEYYQWTSTESAPSNTSLDNWTSTTIPSASGNQKYLWNFELITYTSGEPRTKKTDVARLTTLVNDGRGIDSIEEFYIWWNSGTTAPAKSHPDWYQSDNPKSPTATNKYLWNYEVIHFDDGSADFETDPVLLSQNGDDGRSLLGMAEYYQWTANNSAPSAPSSSALNGAPNTVGNWKKNDSSSSSTTDKYLWNFEYITYSVGGSTITPVSLVGTIGDDGKGIDHFEEYYYWGSSKTTYPSTSTIGNSSTSWCDQDHLDTLSAQTEGDSSRRYLWNFEKIVYTEGNETTDPIIIAINGEIGNGINDVQEYYLWTTSASLTGAQNDHANSSDPASVSYTDDTRWRTDWYASPNSKTYRYLWNFEIITYTVDSTPYRTSPALIGTIGEDGRGIESVTEKYLWHTSNTGITTSNYTTFTWYTADQLPAPTGDQKYLWNYESVVYTDNETPVDSTPIVISIKGDKGVDGKNYQFVYFLSKNNVSSFTIESNNDAEVTTSSGVVEVFPLFKAGTIWIAHPGGSHYTGTGFGDITDDPSGVSEDWPYEYESQGYTDSGGSWHFSIPSLKNNWAKDGEDGDPGEDGYSEYFLYKRGTRSSAPSVPSGQARISDMTSNDWSADRAYVTSRTNDDNPVVWATSTLVSVNEITDPATNTYRNWTPATIVFEKGPKGDDGQGLEGAVVRGPVKWEDADSGRLWNSGDTEEENNIRYIDIVFHDGHYYRCKTTHNHTGSAHVPGNDSNYWTLADGEYEFIATDLLLATNAKIKFLSGNQLILTYDDNGTEKISGGAVGGTGVNFWSGGTSPDDSNNKFTVDYEGNLTSTAGTIGGWEIHDNYLSSSGTWTGGSAGGNNSLSLKLGEISGSTSIQGGHTSTYSGTFSLMPGGLSFTGNNSVTYSSDTSYSMDLDYYSLSFDTTKNQRGYVERSIASIGAYNGITLEEIVDDVSQGVTRITNSYIQSNMVTVNNDLTASTISASESIVLGARSVALSAGHIPFKIAIVTDDSSLFTVSGGEWYFNDAATGIPASSRSISSSGNEYTLYDSERGDYVGSGVYDTSVSRRGDTIYIEI